MYIKPVMRYYFSHIGMVNIHGNINRTPSWCVWWGGELTLPYNVNGRINWYNLSEVNLAMRVNILVHIPFFKLVNLFLE